MEADAAFALLIPPLAAALGALAVLAKSEAAKNNRRAKDTTAAHAKIRRLERTLELAGIKLAPEKEHDPTFTPES